MFKLESYVTPLLLSYVNKYIKNLKPEDSQVSLWGGDAVFNNLDLRLEVLEQELKLPFTFINGHIHELRIHVPWTKLGSEPIIITINTIECILKLKDAVDKGNGEHSSAKADAKKRSRRIDIEDIPPSYVQSLIGRITSNISIVCNNLILKYVEDDIVLSLNVKSAEVCSANENWEKAFVDLVLPELVLRKLITLQDLTVCLDQRNASGKIESYQDPLLYRCSLEGRLYIAYDSLTAKASAVTRMDILCDNLEFSITDQQLPMFFRLLQLCIALYYGELDGGRISQDANREGHETLAPLDYSVSETTGQEESLATPQDSWGSWAWSFVPQIIPVWEDDEDTEQVRGTKSPPPVLHFGIFVNNASFVFKLTENTDYSTNHTNQKVTFRPFACLYQEGIFLTAVLRDPDCANIQLGIESIRLASLGECICRDFGGAASHVSGMDPIFFRGGQFGNEGFQSGYLLNSLFDVVSPENRGQRREYGQNWDDHFAELTEIKMLDHSPAFSMDYFYYLDLNEVTCSDHSSSISLTDLENSNLKERTMARFILGPAELNVTRALIHRYDKFVYSARIREYEPYSRPSGDNMESIGGTLTNEEITILEEYIPYRTYSFVVIKPVINIYAADHPKCDVSAKNVTTKKKKRRNISTADSGSMTLPLPAIVLQCNRIELDHNKVMYPRRVVRAANSMYPPTEHLLHNSHCHISVKVFGFELSLKLLPADPTKCISIIPTCSGVFNMKELLLPSQWKNPFQPKAEYFCELARLSLRFTWPQLLLLHYIYNTWMQKEPNLSIFSQTSLMKDALNLTKEQAILEVAMTGLEWKSSFTDSVSSHIGWMGTIRVFLTSTNEGTSTVTVMHGPEDKGNIHATTYFQEPINTQAVDFLLASDRCFNVVLQYPQNHDICSAPSVLVASLKGVSVCLDPCLYHWLDYAPIATVSFPVETVLKSTRPDDPVEAHSKGSAQSTTPITAPSGSHTQSCPAISGEGGSEKQRGRRSTDWTTYFISLNNVLRRLTVQVNWESCSIFMPVKTLVHEQGSANIIRNMRKAFAAGILPDTLVVNLPRLIVHNGTHKQNIESQVQDVPIVSVDGWNIGADLFPWTITLTFCSVYSLHESRIISPCLRPSSLAATVALTTKCTPVASDKVSHLSLCIHADMEPLRFCLSEKQVTVMIAVTQKLLGVLLRCVPDSLTGKESSTATPCSSIHQPTSAESHAEMTDVEAPIITNFDNIPAAKTKVGVQPKSQEHVKPKLSLWLQWTLPRLTVDLLSLTDAAGTRISMDIEEVTVSLDVQEIYTKLKLKVTAVNCNHYQKIDRANNHWKPGPFQGIIMCCSEKLNRTVHIPNAKTGSIEVSPHLGMFDTQSLKTSETSYSFLSVTLTRALCKNAQRRWSHLLRETADDVSQAKSAEMCQKPRYISEIDVKLQSFDCVLWCPVLLKGLQILQPLQRVSPRHGSSVQSTIPNPIWEQVNSLSQCFNNNTLPLLYLNASTVRVFIPTEECAKGHERLFMDVTAEDQISSPSSSSSKMAISKPVLNPKRKCVKIFNMCIIQIESVHITPQVDNPLSRIVLRSDIYSLAQQARIIHVPGSEVEDRQYQVDITGISLSTGSWDELICHSNVDPSPTLSSKLHTMGENPALEWNYKLVGPGDTAEDSELVFLPISSRFNIRVLLAPSVVYQKHKDFVSNPEPVLICGHSFEVNVTSDLDITISFQQLALLHNLANTNFACFLAHDVSTVQETDSDNKLDSISVLKPQDVRQDSGIDSDISTLKPTEGDAATPLIIGPSPELIVEQQLAAASGPKSQRTTYIPSEILLTAGCISVMLYTNGLKRSESRIKEHKKSGPLKRKKSKHRPTDGPPQAIQKGSVKRSDLEWKEPLSESSSPVRQLSQPQLFFQHASGQKLETNKLLPVKDGYEGSEEESIDDCATSISQDERSATLDGEEIVPIMYFVFAEPHTFLRCTQSTQKLEVSFFDINIKGAVDRLSFPVTELKQLPSPDDYTIPWLETKPGDAHVKTGIPPALVTFTILDFLRGNADVKLKIRRPLKLEFSVEKYEQAVDFVEGIKLATAGESPKYTINSELHTTVSVEKFDTIHFCTWRYLLEQIRIARFSTVQFAFALKTIPHKENAHLIFSLAESSGTIEFKTDKEGILNEVIVGTTFDSYVLKTSYYNKLRSLVGPSTTAISVNAVWESWNTNSSLPRICCNFETEAFFLQLGRDHVACLAKLADHGRDFFVLNDQDEHTVPHTKKQDDSVLKKQQLEDCEQHWHDDLRIGTFQYIQDTDDVGIQPGPYEIVFCREQAGQAASMTWCYPQPRAMTRAEVYPVPFRTASDFGGQVNLDTREQVTCVLQYWDQLLRSFVTYHRFQLSETQHCLLELPHILADGGKQIVVAHKWRVVLDYEEEEDEFEEIVLRRSLVSPLALAACMRVDSYFNPALIPSIQARVAFELVQFSLFNHFQHLGRVTPSLLQPFVFDGVIPYDQEFVSVTLQNFCGLGSRWQNNFRLNLNSTLQVDIVEFRNLTMQSLVEPFRLYSEVHFVKDKLKPSVVEASLLAEPLFFRIGQGVVHTLNTALKCWSQPTGKAGEQLLMNYYVVCNDTQETIRFGQVDMDESIVLHSRQMHAYSWRSQKTKQLLHVCVEGMRWKWCEPFTIDKVGMEVRTMEQKGLRTTLIIKVKQLDSIQKQVTICGQVVLSSRLNQHLEVKLAVLNTNSEQETVTTIDQDVILSQQATAASCVVEPDVIKGLRVRFKNSNTAWSQEISFPSCAVQDTKLVKIPLKEKGQFINVWCQFFLQQIRSSFQHLVLFTPLYVIQTHLPQSLNLVVTTPSLGQSHTVEIEGQGSEYQLHCPGGTDITHQLAFQLAPGLEASKPTLPLSVNMINQVTKCTLPASVDIEEMCSSWMAQHSVLWPYDNEEIEWDLEKLPTAVAECIKKEHAKKVHSVSTVAQTNIDLEVCLEQRWPSCNTLLVDVKPWGLVSNRCSLELVLQSVTGQEWTIPPGETVACPKLEESLKLGVLIDDQLYLSESLKLSDDDWSYRHNWPQVYATLPLKGCVQCAIDVCDETQTLQCCLTIDTKEKYGMRIIAVHSTYNIINNTRRAFKIGACCVSRGSEKVEFLSESATFVKVNEAGTVPVVQPLQLWEVFNPDASFSVATSDSVKYLSLCHLEESHSRYWSLPCRLRLKNTNGRHVVAVPTRSGSEREFLGLQVVTKSYVISAHELNNIVYLSIAEDHAPHLLLRNNCDVPLNFGQSPKHHSEGVVVHEENEIVYQLPQVMSQTMCHYTFPYVSAMFPELHELQKLPKLHLAKAAKLNSAASNDDVIETMHWSCGIDISSNNDLFLNIPDYSDVKIHLEKIGCTMYIQIDPVSRVEVSAKEIRSRIRSKDVASVTLSGGKIPHFPLRQKVGCNPQDSLESVQTESTADSGMGSGSEEKPQTSRDPLPVSDASPATVSAESVPDKTMLSASISKKNKADQELLCYSSVMFKHICIVLVDETSQPDKATEIARASLDYATIVFRPRAETARKTQKLQQVRALPKQEIVVCVGNLQLDNQMLTDGNYDFSVVLVQQNEYKMPVLQCKPNMDVLLQSVRADAVLTVEILLQRDEVNEVMCFQNVCIAVKPLMVYIEDTFLYKLVAISSSFVPSNVVHAKRWQLRTERQLPRVVAMAAATYQSPIQMQKFIIQPVALLLSLHASMKLYISLDQTPFVFKAFERTNVLTSTYRLAHILTIHYLSGALFRAGWVVGSLDLIGNPGGFARAVGSGMSDFVSLPYQGFVRGPWAFVAGVANGSTSLIRHITAGTLVSITNMASSVSRNMELLSLDEEYRQRNEETRRHKPDSLSCGLTQGLTGFGISLLGAVAGIVDQPLQSIQRAVEQPNFPATAAVTGILSGVSKGLVGIVAKPLGGAAEFLAQAGHGILHGTGWSKTSLPRYESLRENAHDFTNSRLKYVWKMLPDLPLVEVVFALEATQLNQAGHYVANVLLLTSQVLFLVNIDEDTQQQAFSLAELDCHGYTTDPTLIYLVPRQKPGSQSPQPEEQTQDRVTDFVNKAAKYVAMQAREESETHSDSSSGLNPVGFISAVSMQFYVNPRLRNTFLTLFRAAQRNVLGKGFPV